MRSVPTAASSSLLDRAGGPRRPGAQSPACLPACQPAGRWGTPGPSCTCWGRSSSALWTRSGDSEGRRALLTITQLGQGPGRTGTRAWPLQRPSSRPLPAWALRLLPSAGGPRRASDPGAPDAATVSLLGRVHHQALQPGSWSCPCLPGGVLPGIRLAWDKLPRPVLMTLPSPS